MRYLPHTAEEVTSMLAEIGEKSLESLFSSIPEHCRTKGDLDLPAPLNEWSLKSRFKALGETMKASADAVMLIGAGSYHHHIPELVPALASRSEFLTAYTPYQPEMAQGTLQGIFEYQTLTARLLGMDIANASMYDGASALAEGLLMTLRIKKKARVVAISRAVHPHYREVVHTYFRPTAYEVVELPVDDTGRTDLSGIDAIDGLAAVALQSPNFFGIIEELEPAGESIHANGALMVAGFTEPLAFGLYQSPGECNADIACGEGQSMGLPRNFGGPGLGMFACRSDFMRAMPGRLVGETRDQDGQRGYVLTLSTREQHIRREKATSNICSNQGVCALTSAIYMASLGGTGIRRLARLNFDKSEYFKKGLAAAGAEIIFSAPTFNEFVARCPAGFAAARQGLMEQDIYAGLALEPLYPELSGAYLFCATETVSREDMDRVIKEVQA
ncbi:MAG: aminomethyl-transferring glycine dehydrogenase [Desulfobulbus propionicus]|nr:MAG: aminomethyl-transferring glycine dehydrogenase [Desulfobulbus propionicus]